MILLFPDLDTLRLAMTSTFVPTQVTLAPAAVTRDDQGRIYVESSVSLPESVTRSLKRIGVKGSKRHATDSPEEVTCWLQILPLTRDPTPPNLTAQAPILFELGSADDLPVLVTEMLRLGNDRQSFRWFADGSDADSKRVLLRVIGPPYYTLLRALDRSAAGTAGTIRAYVERSPRVWVEIGHDHPFAAEIRVADTQLLLIRSPGEWLFLDDTPFQDVYDVLQFKLPANPIGWTEAKTPKKMTVPLRLTAGNAADVPELWVLRDGAVEHLDALVRDADERLTQRLMFAVADTPAGERSVILRTRPSKLAPPVLPIESAVGFKPFWKLPNLFLPVGKRLHPTLRRDAVRKLLADDPDQVVWLYPDAAGAFTPESVPDGAFRSLEDWVDYVIEVEQQPLAGWIEATRFDFDHFVCKDPGGPKPKPDKPEKEPKASDDPKSAPGAAAPKPPAKAKSQPRTSGSDDYLPAPEVVKPPSEWKIRLVELEKQFLALDGPLDAPERQALWPELAKANAGLGSADDQAAVCWLHALWETTQPPNEWLAAWVRAEFRDAGPAITAADLDKRLHAKNASATDARAVIAAFLWLTNQEPVPPWLVTRLPTIQKYLDAHERAIPVRAVWLAAQRLAHLSGSDVLGLARVRDRLLQRLLDEGLSPERDIPSFLRYAGLHDSEQLRVVRDKATDLHAAVRVWVENCAIAQKNDAIRQNLPYVDLLFAFAFARLGEATPAKKLLEDARKVMETKVPAAWQDHKNFDAVVAAVTHNYLYRGFRHRVEQVLIGKQQGGQLSAALAEATEEIIANGAIEMPRGPNGQTDNPYRRADYVIGRIREQSRILEPHERLHPYAKWMKHGDTLMKELADLQTVREPAKLADRIRRLFKDRIQGQSSTEVQILVLHEAVPLSPRVGEAFTVELLNLVPAALAAGTGVSPEPSDGPKKQGELLERSLFFAGHFDRGDLVQKLVGHFVDLVHAKADDARYKLVNAVGGQVLRSLKKLGLRTEMDRFLARLQSEILRGATLPELRKRYADKPAMWCDVLQTLLNLAAGWMTFGQTDTAAPILDEARKELLSPSGVRLHPKDYTALARAYVGALGQGPSETGLPRITELFRKMDPTKITNTWTTGSCYSRDHLALVEAVIHAMVSDEFALGPAGRRWLDDDEYLVRRRIHADMKREKERQGL